MFDKSVGHGYNEDERLMLKVRWFGYGPSPTPGSTLRNFPLRRSDSTADNETYTQARTGIVHPKQKSNDGTTSTRKVHLHKKSEHEVKVKGQAFALGSLQVGIQSLPLEMTVQV